jgi:hypothetical protein
VAALFDQLKDLAGFRGRWDDAGSAGGNKLSEMGGQNESKGIERRCLLFVRSLDFALARLVYVMVVRGDVIVGVQMGVDKERVNAVAMDVLKRRQNIGGYKRDTAVERKNPPRHEQCSASRASARKTIRQALIDSDSRQLSFASNFLPVQEHTVTRTRSLERVQWVESQRFPGW